MPHAIPITLRPVWLWLAATLSTAACHTQPVAQTQSTPTLDQVRSRVEPTPPPTETLQHQPIALLAVHRFDLPRNASFDDAWQAIDENALPPTQATAWRANRLRVGVLSNKHTDAFLDALPPTRGRQHHTMTLSHHPTALTIPPPFTQPIELELITPPGQTQTLTLDTGRFQFLVRIVTQKPNTAWLELTPHCYQPHPTIQPRLPHEKAADGQTFDELRLQVPLPLNGWLAIAWEPPPPKPEDPDTPTTQPAEPPASQPHAPPQTQPTATQPLDWNQTQTPPHRLGDALLTTYRLGQPIQSLLLLTAHPAPSTTP